MTIDLWLALVCAVLFSTGALLVKRANQLGVGPWPATLMSNLTTAAGFIALWPLGGQVPAWSQWWQPALVAVTFVVGQALVFMAYHRGDVSVATPVLGIKVVLVAVFTTAFIGARLSWQLWTGAVLSTLAVVLLNRTERSASGKAGMTVLLTMGCAVNFALFDVLTQKWGQAWGVGRFLPIMMLMVAAMSLAAHPFFRGGRLGLTGAPSIWLWSGTLLIALQSTVFVAAIVIYQNAAPANVVFSSRGLWSVVLVWGVGHWFHSSEQRAGASVLGWRFAGAAIMMLAIALVMLGR